MKPLKQYIDEKYACLNNVDERVSAAASQFNKSKRTIYNWLSSGAHFVIECVVVEVKADGHQFSEWRTDLSHEKFRCCKNCTHVDDSQRTQEYQI